MPSDELRLASGTKSGNALVNVLPDPKVAKWGGDRHAYQAVQSASQANGE
jgi:hypothetical protein